jgi:hypothetical protein
VRVSVLTPGGIPVLIPKTHTLTCSHETRLSLAGWATRTRGTTKRRSSSSNGASVAKCSSVHLCWSFVNRFRPFRAGWSSSYRGSCPCSISPPLFACTPLIHTVVLVGMILLYRPGVFMSYVQARTSSSAEALANGKAWETL